MSALPKLLASVAKELRVILRDPPALAVLFLMPLGFVIVMSLALQDVMADADPGSRMRFSLTVLDEDRDKVGQAVIDALQRIEFIDVTVRRQDDGGPDREGLRERVRSGATRIALVLPSGLTKKLDAELARGDPSTMFDVPPQRKLGLQLMLDPALRPDYRLLIVTALSGVLRGVEIHLAVDRYVPAAAPAKADAGEDASDGLLALEELHVAGSGAAGTRAAVAPTSAQQNVPAYSLLAIFMLVVPLSQTFLKERAQGSLMRLRSMPVAPWIIIVGKSIPYFFINMLQMTLCLAVGRYLLPVLGGSALLIGDALPGIAILCMAASIAAIGFALVIATFTDTPEQATAFGATAVLLLSALGGIMVPRMLMPPFLQELALLSPMGWAQEGFLQLLVRGAPAADVAGEAGKLLAFGLVCLMLAAWRFGRLDGAR